MSNLQPWIVSVGLALLVGSCGGKSEETPGGAAANASDKTSTGGDESSARPRVSAPEGLAAGEPFAPDLVMLLEDGRHGRFSFHVQGKRAADRLLCQEPLGSASVAELTAIRDQDEWPVGAATELPLDRFSGSMIEYGAKPTGTARLTLREKNVATFELAGDVEIQSPDGRWKLAGPFRGEYCPSKIRIRETAEPIHGLAWTMDAVEPGDLPASPVAAVLAGVPAEIAHVSLRETQDDKGPRHELLFFTSKPPEDCAARPTGGRSAVYIKGKLAKRTGPGFVADSFTVRLVAPPRPDTRASGGHDRTEQIDSGMVHWFEPDETRTALYAQYFSAAIAIDALDEKTVRGRVYLATKDSGKSMLVGAFTGVRCPPE